MDKGNQWSLIEKGQFGFKNILKTSNKASPWEDGLLQV
jgi:hypothetical protein